MLSSLIIKLFSSYKNKVIKLLTDIQKGGYVCAAHQCPTDISTEMDFRLAIVIRRAAAMQLGSGLPHASIRGLRPPAAAVDDFTACSST